MKSKILFLVLTFLAIPALGQYMSSADIQLEISKLSKQESSATLNKQGISRLKDLNDLETFFDKQELEALKKREKFEYNPQTVEIKESTDLRQYDSPIRAQDNGKCTAYSLLGIMENLITQKSPRKLLNLSDWHHWSHYKKYSCVASLQAALTNYICDESNYPQGGRQKLACNKTAWAKVSGQRYIGSSVTEMRVALSRNNPVYLAMATPIDMLNCKKVISPNSAASTGGHALGIVGNLPPSGGEIVATIRNSWGSNCGDKGYQYMPMSICNKPGFYCEMWEITGVTVKQ